MQDQYPPLPDEIDIDSLSYGEAAKYFDSTTFSVEPFVRVEGTSWGERSVFTPEGLPYIGSELRFNEGGTMDEQVSDRFRLYVFREGGATIQMEDAEGIMITKQMETGLGYRIHKGQRYKIHADNVSVIMEAMMPEPYNGETHKHHFYAEEYVMRIGKPWGHELHFGKEDDPLMVKILHINSGDRLSEKAHRVKIESYWMLSGECNFFIENSNRTIVSFPLKYNTGYTVRVGQRHRQQGSPICEFFEVSMPEGGKTWRIQDDYERPDETDEQRRLERGEMA